MKIEQFSVLPEFCEPYPYPYPYPGIWPYPKDGIPIPTIFGRTHTHTHTHSKFHTRTSYTTVLLVLTIFVTIIFMQSDVLLIPRYGDDWARTPKRMIHVERNTDIMRPYFFFFLSLWCRLRHKLFLSLWRRHRRKLFLSLSLILSSKIRWKSSWCV